MGFSDRSEPRSCSESDKPRHSGSEALYQMCIRDRPYDDDPEGGCFSGSAVEKDGRLWLFYTGAVKRGGKAVQTRCVYETGDKKRSILRDGQRKTAFKDRII